MNKSVLISIQPKWCELIASGKKTIEVRKTRPKLETPFKCYIYCTKSNSKRLLFILKEGDENYGEVYHGKPIFVKVETGGVCDMFYKREKVIGEFVCAKIEKFVVGSLACDTVEEKACLSYKEICDYFYGDNYDNTVRIGYGWHISDLKIYDKPKELGEFISHCSKKKSYPSDLESCRICCEYNKPIRDKGNQLIYRCDRKITRPFQSWGYIEEPSE